VVAMALPGLLAVKLLTFLRAQRPLNGCTDPLSPFSLPRRAFSESEPLPGSKTARLCIAAWLLALGWGRGLGRVGKEKRQLY